MADTDATLPSGRAPDCAYLADRPLLLPALSALLHAQWGDRAFCATRTKIEQRFAGRMQRDAVPFTFLALDPADPARLIGTASITLHELPQFGDRRFWLSEVCVDPAARGQGVGRHLIETCQRRAAELGVTRLHLYTFSKAALYQSLGWQEDASVVLEGLRHALMSIELRH